MKNESFFKRVYRVVRKIPKGRVTSYGAIADYLGTGLSARMVGWAMNSCPQEYPPIPAHRVLNRNGLLTGRHHFSTPTLMQELLEKEGIEVTGDQVKEFHRIFWDPNVELRGRVNKTKKSPAVKRRSK